MSLIGRPAGRTGRLSRSRGACVAALLIAVSASGCGGPGSADPPGPGVTNAVPPGEVTVSEAQLQNIVDQALSVNDVEASSLPPLMQEALARASRELTSAQLDKAYECWKATSCSLGEGGLTLAHVDVFASNTWRQFTKMNVILQALTHPEVGKYIYTDANYDLATYQANLRTVTAQGADAIVTINEFGPAAHVALATAERQGASIATYVGAMEDAPDDAYTTRVQYDLCATGKAMAETMAKATSTNGPVAYFEGLAGNPQDAKVRACVMDAGVQTAFTEATEFTAAGTQKAASALIASGTPAEAILYSYANTVPSIVNAYTQAGKDIPAIITTTQSNATACQREDNPYPLFFTNSANWASRISVDASVLAAKGGEAPRSVVFPLPFFEATSSNCDRSKPAEYPGPTLVPDVLTEKMLTAE